MAELVPSFAMSIDVMAGAVTEALCSPLVFLLSSFFFLDLVSRSG
jgi:hypothetical protein